MNHMERHPRIHTCIHPSIHAGMQAYTQICMCIFSQTWTYITPPTPVSEPQAREERGVEELLLRRTGEAQRKRQVVGEGPSGCGFDRRCNDEKGGIQGTQGDSMTVYKDYIEGCVGVHMDHLRITLELCADWYEDDVHLTH